MRPTSAASTRMWLAHEYTHHGQALMLPDHFWAVEALLEGHALSVQKLFVLEDGSPEMQQEWFNLEARLLMAAYLIACACAETHPSPLVTVERVDPLFRVPHHAIGLAVFCLALERHGPRVLRAFLNGEFLIQLV